MINSSYYLATSDRCSVPAPSIAFCAGGWLAIVGQLRGKGRDRVGAAEPEESVLGGVGCRGSGVGEASLTAAPRFSNTPRATRGLALGVRRDSPQRHTE